MSDETPRIEEVAELAMTLYSSLREIGDHLLAQHIAIRSIIAELRDSDPETVAGITHRAEGMTTEFPPETSMKVSGLLTALTAEPAPTPKAN